MLRDLFGQMNYWAILVSGIVYWLIGMVWFSAIVGKNWSEEIKNHGIKLGKPTKGKMIEKSIWTFILNLIVAWGIALLVYALGINTFGAALGLGLVLAVCFAVAVLATTYLWEGRSFRLSFYDIFYPFLGIIVSTLIISLWR